jgi:hypothetical protein
MAAGKVPGKASAAIPEPKSSKSAKAKTADSESASRSNPSPDGMKPSRTEAKSPAKKSPPPK